MDPGKNCQSVKIRLRYKKSVKFVFAENCAHLDPAVVLHEARKAAMHFWPEIQPTQLCHVQVKFVV